MTRMQDGHRGHESMSSGTCYALGEQTTQPCRLVR